MIFRKNTEKNKKIGVFGGCFDPIHKGHVAGALFAKQALSLNEIWFSISPTKFFSEHVLSSVKDRTNMVELAIQKFKYFYVKTDEVEQKLSTTYDLISYYKKKHPTYEFYLIIGDDQLPNFEKWNNVSELVNISKIAVLRRANSIDNELTKLYKPVIDKYNMNLLANKIISGSSTNIREGIDLQNLENIVIKYINNNNLYAKQRVRKFVNDERFQHILNVEELALTFAKKHRLNISKVQAAAIYHDIAKQWKMTDLIKYVQSNISIYKDHPAPTLHAYVGAHFIKTTYGITDIDVLSAISKHTTAEIKMSSYDKVMYCADKLSKDRVFPEQKHLIDEVMKNLNNGFGKVLFHNFQYLVKKNVIIDKKSFLILKKFCSHLKEYQAFIKNIGINKK